MDENKEDAVKCIRLAEQALSAGDREKAIRFVQKAEKFYSTQKGKDLLETLLNQKTKSEPEEPPRKRKTSVKREEMNNKHTSETEAEYTKAQLEAVHRVKKCKTLYDMLGVPKTAKNDEIKKAYKQLAFQLHPDKNKAPGADEAFKKIGNAHEVLINPDKRKHYDQIGDERSFQRNNHHNYREYDGRRHFTAQDMTAEEIFQMFFGAGFPQTGHMRQENWHRQQQQHSTHRESANGCSVILQMLPILLLIVLSMMSSFFISDPLYSLHQSQKFPIQRVTYKLKVPYYVKENFHTEYQGSLKRLETSVEDEYITNLRHSCYREKNYRDSMIWRARNFGDQQMFHQAKNIRMPSCDALSELNP